jgi:hypothetical protein
MNVRLSLRLQPVCLDLFFVLSPPVLVLFLGPAALSVWYYCYKSDGKNRDVVFQDSFRASSA